MNKINESKDERLARIWNEHKDGKQYQKTLGLESMIPLCVDFYEGRHWGKISDKTKTLPRPIFNQIEMIVDSKGAGILATPLKILFSSQESPELANKLTAFNTQMEKEMKLDEIFSQMVNQAEVEGSSFLHLFWDAEAVGKRGEYKGGTRAEIIEPLNVVVHNPRETDIQKQKWIIIETRCELDAVKAMCQNKHDATLIEPDDNENLRDEKEQDGSKLVTVLTKYFRKDGEVYFEKVTKNVILCDAKALNPDINRQLIKVKQKEDSAESNLPDEPKVETIPYRATLYPIEVYQYKRRKNCIYGRGEVEPIIPNNRVVNFNTAMMSKSVEDQGFGQVCAKEGAMAKGDKFTNDPTKILIDRYKGGTGFYTLQKQPFNPQTYQLNKDILETTRSVTGATEVMTGEIMGANQSGASIAYLQQQAQKPIDNLAKRYRKFRERCAEILLQFYVLFYEDKEFYNEMSGDEAQSILQGQLAQQGASQEQIAKELANMGTETIKFKDMFNGSEFRDYEFDITIEIGAGTQYSEIVTVNILDNLLNSGKISLRTYYNVYPSNLLPNKKELLQDLDNQEQGQIAQLSQMVQNQQAQIEQYAKVTQKLTEIANNISGTINENKHLKELLAQQMAEKHQLQAEYTDKINLANQQIITSQQDANDLAELIKMQGGNANANDMSTLQGSLDEEE